MSLVFVLFTILIQTQDAFSKSIPYDAVCAPLHGKGSKAAGLCSQKCARGGRTPTGTFICSDEPLDNCPSSCFCGCK